MTQGALATAGCRLHRLLHLCNVLLPLATFLVLNAERLVFQGLNMFSVLSPWPFRGLVGSPEVPPVLQELVVPVPQELELN